MFLMFSADGPLYNTHAVLHRAIKQVYGRFLR